MFIKYEAEVSSRVGGGERGVVDFGKLFTETNEQKFSPSPHSPSLGLLFEYQCTSSKFIRLANRIESKKSIR